jgi:hypothetical protein
LDVNARARLSTRESC